MITCRDFADQVGLSMKHIRNLIRWEKIKAKKIPLKDHAGNVCGHQYMISLSELNRFKKERKKD